MQIVVDNLYYANGMDLVRGRRDGQLRNVGFTCFYFFHHKLIHIDVVLDFSHTKSKLLTNVVTQCGNMHCIVLSSLG